MSARATAPGLGETPHRSVVSVLVEHRRVLLTLGLGVLIISAARATRQSIVPLWAESIGLNAATTSVIFGISAGVDMLLFYPGGAIMDRFGRVYVAVPAMIVLGLGFCLLPLTSGATSVGLVAAMMGLGNGISSGVVMTLGADASPAQDRTQFLGGWRVCSDLGNAAGPLVVSAVSAGDVGSRRDHDGVAHLGGLGMADQVGAQVRSWTAQPARKTKAGKPDNGDK